MVVVVPSGGCGDAARVDRIYTGHANGTPALTLIEAMSYPDDGLQCRALRHNQKYYMSFLIPSKLWE